MTTYRIVGPQSLYGDAQVLYHILRNDQLVSVQDTCKEAVSEVYRLQAGEKVRKAIDIWKQLNQIDIVIEEQA